MYAIYLRKSRADIEAEVRGEMETLARHEKALTELAAKQNLSVAKIYKEIVSGETIDARPQMQCLLSEVERGVYDGVIVMEIERLARGDTIDQGIVAKAFKRYGTVIVTPTKTYDPGNEFDEEYFEFGLFMSRREYKTINRRIQRGRRAAAEEGKYIASTPPYGYDKVKVEGSSGYTLQPNADAEVVKMIYKLYLAGYGKQSIANRLDDMGIAPRYRDTWSKSTITTILTNPVYCGKIRWGYRVYDNQSPYPTSRRKLNDCIYADGLHQPIITADDFDNVQEALKNRYRAPVKKNLSLRNPLSGLGLCGLCGAPLTRLGGGAKSPCDYIKCTSGTRCKCVSSPMHLVEQRLINMIKEYIMSYQAPIADTKNEVSREFLKRSEKSYKKELEALDKQIAKTHDLLEQEVYDIDTYIERKTTLEKEKKELKSRLKATQEDLKNQQSKRKVIDPKSAMKLLSIYETTSDAKEKNAILKTLIKSFEYTKLVPNKKGQIDNANFNVKCEIKF